MLYIGDFSGIQGSNCCNPHDSGQSGEELLTAVQINVQCYLLLPFDGSN